MHALRSLARSPGFTGIATLTLALGIGAATTIFSVVHALLLAPLPYGQARELVQLRSRHPEQGDAPLAPATFQDVAAGSASFAVTAAQNYYYYNLTQIGTATRTVGVQATVDYFKLWDVAPLLGRTWRPDEARAASAPVVVLSEAIWRQHYGANPALLGQAITIDDTAVTVIGVMPASFQDPWGNACLWRPIATDGPETAVRTSRYWAAFARLKPGVSLAQANAEIATVAARLGAAHPDTDRGWTLVAGELQGAVVGEYHTGLLVLLGAVGCVLLITCANVAGLNVVRAAARRKELAVRSALGASRGQLLRQLLAESLLLALLGGAGGLLIASWSIEGLLRALPEGWLPRAQEISLNAPVLAAACGLTLITGLAFGLLPGWLATRAEASEALKETARSSAGAGTRRLRAGLVVGEITLAFALLTGAGLLGRSFLAILQQRPGMELERVLALTVSLSDVRYATPEKRGDFYTRAEAAVAAVPGVTAAGFTQTSPFRWGIPLTLVPVERDGSVAATAGPPVFYDSVSVDFFRATGVPVLAGRSFTTADRAGGKPVCLLSHATARRMFGDSEAVGREVTGGPGSPTRLEVIGVVGDVRRNGLANEIPLQAYRPLAQRPTAFATLMVRTPLAPAALAKSVQAALARLDPDTPVSEVASLASVAQRTVTAPRLHLTLFAVFATLALLLAAIGLYGLIAYSVAQRTREFGIRTALGASPADLLRQVLLEGGRLVGLGLGLGIAAATLGAQLLRQLVFETSVHDPVVLGGVAAIFVAVATLACLIPARRAARVDPMIALRAE